MFDVPRRRRVIRQAGSIGQVIVIVIAEEISVNLMGDELTKVFQRIENKELPTAIALTRIVVKARSRTRRRAANPEIRTLTFNGAALPVGARLLVHAGEEVQLGRGARELARASGKAAHGRREQAGGGGRRVVLERRALLEGNASDVTDTAPTVYTRAGLDEVPRIRAREARSGQLWLVVRDNRGAQSYQQFRITVCDGTQPTPVVKSLMPPAGATDPVVVLGDNLQKATDVVIGDYALVNGAFSSAQGGFVGFLPEGVAGGHLPVARAELFGHRDRADVHRAP